jgi:imidazolonepropionase-like amidohydrolase
LSSQQYYTCCGNVQLAHGEKVQRGTARPYRYDGQASMNSNKQRRHALPIICQMLCLALFLTGCKPAEEPGVKAIVGAVLIDGTGGPPISDSVVTIEGSRIRAVGNRASLPVPADSDKIDGSGKFLVPGLIDLQAPLHTSAGGKQTERGIEQDLNRYLSTGVSSVLSAGGGDLEAVRQAQRQGGLLTARLFILGGPAARPDVAELAGRSAAGSLLDQARTDHIPMFVDIFSLADARFGVDNGAAGFLHMIRDTAAIEPAFIARLRDLQVVFVPVLAQVASPGELDLAKHNTKRLADGGVLIGAGSGGDLHHEMELLAEAGLSPAEVLLAATRNNATALRQLDQLGSIEPGKLADLLLVSANPAEDIRNLRAIDRIMLNGQWVDRAR